MKKVGTIHIVRGIPGSGKSTMARIIAVAENCTNRIFEADMFFVSADGKYEYDSGRIKEAHEWCRTKVEEAAIENPTVSVIVSNTFTNNDHVTPYINIAKKYGMKINEVVCLNEFENQHDVPPAVVNRMKDQLRESVLDRLS